MQINSSVNSFNLSSIGKRCLLISCSMFSSIDSLYLFINNWIWSFWRHFIKIDGLKCKSLLSCFSNSTKFLLSPIMPTLHLISPMNVLTQIWRLSSIEKSLKFNNWYVSDCWFWRRRIEVNGESVLLNFCWTRFNSFWHLNKIVRLNSRWKFGVVLK
jgi:hypothetical protein